jgi:ADP-heptose:LPS heptosyltransferase
MGGLVPRVRRIAVLRANGVGDLMFALPALDALKRAYPRAELVLLGAPWHRAFLSGRPGPVDRVEVVPAGPGIRDHEAPTGDPAELERFLAARRAEGYDLALQMHGGGRDSNKLVAALGARVSAGSRTPDAPPLDRWVPYVYLQHEVHRYLEIAGLVGAEPRGLEPRLAVTAADRAEAAGALPDDRRPLAVLHPGASDPRRRWPASSFAVVGDALARAGATVALSGVAAEAEAVAAVRARMAAPALDLCGRVSLGGLAGLLEHSAVLVSNDSGPLHLAAAVGAPTVGIFWTVNLANGAPPFRARHRPFVSHRLTCPECGRDGRRERCPHDRSLVADVDAAEVAAAARELIGAPVQDPAALARALDWRVL